MNKPHLLVEISSLLEKMKLPTDLSSFITDTNFKALLEVFRSIKAFSHELSTDLPAATSSHTLHLLRKLKSAYSLSASQLLSLLSQLVAEILPDKTKAWENFSTAVALHPESQWSIIQLLLTYDQEDTISFLLAHLEKEDPHALYPTSMYRTSSGKVNSTADGKHIEAVMTTSTMTEIQIIEGVLHPDNLILRNLYYPLGKCVCVIDANVHEHYGEELVAYFEKHDITLKMLVYRAMEVDKGIHTVESLLADFKEIGVSRQEPVLIVGGGVITDIGGLACALYHRGTPYVMLATSIVSGIDAGPSPRTCCDGFGFKNLFGAYHAPVLTLTDRTFFKTLRTGWIRHGVAEIIKMATVKDATLFELLEETGVDLVYSQFGVDTEDTHLSDNSQRILALSMQSYVEAEYGNLYETHQCRPHAYGHTWSPGYEIPSGMLHGHAVSCGMGFGAYLSYLQGWISREECDRICQLISKFELSLWHPILDDTTLIYKGQLKIIEKRGGHLVAPLPKGRIGECGYLNTLSFEALKEAMEGYKTLCQTYPREGLGIEPHCHEVGLEDPSTVGHSLKDNATLQKA